MLKSIYPYDGPFSGTLKFGKDQLFVDIREENQYWRMVCTKDGEVGCVPTNFVQKFEPRDKSIIKNFAEKAIDKLNKSEVRLKDELAIIRRLKNICLSTENEVSNVDESEVALRNLEIKKIQIINECSLPAVQSEISHPATLMSNGTCQQKSPSVTSHLPRDFQSRLIDVLRLGTNCDYDRCHATLHAFINLLSSALPQLKPFFEDFNKNDSFEENSDFSRNSDWYLIKMKFDHLESELSDDQESNWSLYGNQININHHLNNLLTLLRRANTRLIVSYLKSSELRPLDVLTKLHQRAQSVEERTLLLRIIGFCCSLSSFCVQFCINSVLPGELLRELKTATSQSNIPLLALGLRVLSFLIGRSADLPNTVRESLNSELFIHLIKLSNHSDDLNQNLMDFAYPYNNDSYKNISSSREELNHQRDMLSYSVAIFLLASNRHFLSVSENHTPNHMNSNSTKIPLLQALLSVHDSSYSFLELIVQAFNRNLDPIAMLTFKPPIKANAHEHFERWAELVRFDIPQSPTENSLTNLLNLIDLEFNSEDLKFDDDLQYTQSLWTRDLSEDKNEDQTLPLPITNAPNTPHHSVVKFLCDLFTFPDTASLMYHNDLDVLVNVIMRHIKDLEITSEELSSYLILLGLIGVNSKYLFINCDKLPRVINCLNTFIQSFSENLSLSAKRNQLLAHAALNHFTAACQENI